MKMTLSRLAIAAFLLSVSIGAQLCPCGTGTQADPLIAMSGDPAQIARDVHASAVFYGRTDDDYWIGLSGHVGGPSSDGRYWLGWNRYWESRMDPTSPGSADPALGALPAIHRDGQSTPTPTPTPTPTATPAPIALATCTDIEGFYEKYLGREPAADDCAKWMAGDYGATSTSDVEAQIANSEEAQQHAAQPTPEPTATPSPTPTPEPVATPSPTPAPDPVPPPAPAAKLHWWEYVIGGLVFILYVYGKASV